MASADRPAARALIDRLAESPFGFDLFQALRRLECAHPDRPRIGHSTSLEQDPVRFGQEASLAFAPSTIASCENGSEDKPPKLSVHCFGLLGPNGPMPLHFTEYVRDRVRNRHDPTLANFLDIIHHRLLSLFYRAWAINQRTVCRDRRDEDRFAAYIGSLIGIGMDSYWRRDALADEAKLFYSGRISAQARNAEGLLAILGDYFGMPTEIDQFIGHWVDLPPEYQCRMGESPETGALGQTVVVGERFWDRQHRFRVIFGPLRLVDYERMLPTEPSYRRLVDWVRLYAGQQFGWDAQLILKKQEIPPVVLGEQGRVGWTTWLRSTPADRDADDLILNPAA